MSFIICFDREAWYHRRGFALAAALAALTLSTLPFSGPLERSLRQIGWTSPIADLLTHMLVEALLFLLALFLLCMVCHGELLRRKPPASHLTRFYLSIAAGGALGGVIVAVTFWNRSRVIHEDLGRNYSPPVRSVRHSCDRPTR